MGTTLFPHYTNNGRNGYYTKPIKNEYFKPTSHAYMLNQRECIGELIKTGSMKNLSQLLEKVQLISVDQLVSHNPGFKYQIKGIP